VRPAAAAKAEPAVSPKAQKAAEKAEAFALRLKRAGIALEPEEYQKRTRYGAIGAAFVGMMLGGFSAGGMVFGALLAFGVLKGADWFITFRYNRRLAEFVDQFCDALGVMASGVKSGQTIQQSFETITADFAEPIQGEVEEVLQELRMGVPFDEALNHWVDRLPCEDLEIAATALIVQRQTGGNVAEILDTVADTIRNRNKLQKQIRTLTAQGRASGVVVTLLPVGLFLAMYVVAPARTGLLLTHPLGIVLTALGAGMVGIGSFLINKIVTIEV
jgi:tight adherence protein B